MFSAKSKIVEYLFYALSVSFFIGKSHQVVGVIIVLVFLFDVLRSKNWSIFKDPIFILITFWCGYLLLGVFWAINSSKIPSGVFTIFCWNLLYLAFKTIMAEKEKIERFMKFQAWLILFLVFNLIMQFFVGVNIFGTPIIAQRATDILGSDRVYAYIFPFWIGLFGALLTLQKKETKHYLLYGAALMGILISMPLSGARGALIILVVFLPLIAWMSPYRKVAFGVLGIMLVLAFAMVSTMPHLQKRLASLANPFEAERQIRVSLWLTAFEQFKDNPIVGIGFKNFRDRQFEYYKKEFDSIIIVPDEKQGATHAHSPWMDILAEQGIVGILFGLSLLGFIMFNAYKSGVFVIIGSMGVWYSFSFLNSSFILSSSRWSFFMILSISFYAIVMNYAKFLKEKKE